MSKYEKMPIGAFDKMTYGAGIILANFSPETGAVKAEDILYATKGGNAFSATRDITDMGTDIDNCPEGVMQLQKTKPYQANISGTAVTLDAEGTKDLLANAGVSGDAVKKITPRDCFEMNDFKDKWLVVNYSGDNAEETGGFIAFHLMNAINIDGMSANFAKEKNGEFPYNFKAFYDLDDLGTVPFEVYVKAGTAEGATGATGATGA